MIEIELWKMEGVGRQNKARLVDCGGKKIFPEKIENAKLFPQIQFV